MEPWDGTQPSNGITTFNLISALGAHARYLAWGEHACSAFVVNGDLEETPYNAHAGESGHRLFIHKIPLTLITIFRELRQL
jgi:hypothetical protein